MPTQSTLEAILETLDALILEGRRVAVGSYNYVDSAAMAAWRTRSNAFLTRTFGASDPYVEAFRDKTGE